FWTWVALAALLHDTGKIPYGFQRMVGNTSDEAVSWGERHEILSLGFVEHLLSHLPDDDRLWIAAVVAGHHRPYTGVNAPRVLLAQLSDDTADDFHERFSRIDPEQLLRLLRWLRGTARRLDLPVLPDLPEISVRDLTDAAFDVFSRL
ncbi:CRISPR-associated endonuclease Cas3'', partial [Streptomyces sp. SID11233]|nr:CRISPR-associated endonuclease Cas3'' [Streptomyces sp. SID11233]